jgi:hypothetical protein
MEFNLTQAEKIELCQSSKSGIEKELYTLLVRLNVDPETFDEEVGFTGTNFTGEYIRIQELVNALNRVKVKITELS